MEVKNDLRLDAYLEHYGVIGMKWGQRKRDNAKNADYSENQRKRDKQVYGARGEKRINRALNKGETISVARGTEKTKRDTVMGRNKYARGTGKIVGGLGSVGAANLALNGAHKLALSPALRSLIQKQFGTDAAFMTLAASNLLINPLTRIIVSAGAAKFGAMLSGDAAVALNMRLHGYDPNRR